MAEGHSNEEGRIRKYKDIVAPNREITDLNKQRYFLGLSLTSDGRLLVVDYENKEVCTFNRNGKLLDVFEATENSFTGNIAVFSDGNIALNDPPNSDVKVYTPEGAFVRNIGCAEMHNPQGLAVNKEDQLFVVEEDCAKMYVFKGTGELQYSFSIDVEEFVITIPQDICIGSNGLVYVTERDNHVICVYKPNGEFVQMFGGDILSGDKGIGATPDGHIVVSSSTYHKISIFTTEGECIHEVAVGLDQPHSGIVVDGIGNIFVSDPYPTRRIVVF